MNPFIEINGRKIGLDYPPVVIAELGINHGGSLNTAFEMVDAATTAGVEILKHQTHIVSDEMSKAAKNVIPGHAGESIYAIMDRCALNEDEEIQLQKYVESKGIIFISTPFSRAAADRLRKMDIPAYKIGSGECNNYPLIKHIASFGRPIILSTGMNSIDSIKLSVEILRDNNISFALLHCTNVYPTPPHLVRLGALTQLQQVFPDVVVGLSDHSATNYPCLGAVALGACILERHFTDNMQRTGPDISCSMDINATRELIKGSRIIFEARGGQKGPVAEEQSTIDFAFATVVSLRKIKKGEKFTEENTWVKRPGIGEIKAIHYETIIGKKATCNIDEDEHLKWSDISD